MNFSQYPRTSAIIASVFCTMIVFGMSAGPAVEPVATLLA